MTAPKRRWCQIHGGIPRLQTGGIPAAEEEESPKQQRDRPSHRRGHDNERPRHRHQISRRKARPPSVALNDGRGRHRKQGGTDDDGALRQTRHADPRNIGSEQRSHRRPHRDPDAADDLGDEEQSQGTALDDGGFHASGPDYSLPRAESGDPPSRPTRLSISRNWALKAPGTSSMRKWPVPGTS